MKLDCVASIVVYKNRPEMVINAVNSFLNSKVARKLYVVDNSPDKSIEATLSGLDICYHYANSNLGYGRGHNWAIENSESSKYHLILNPDVVIHEDAIEKLVQFMDANLDCGLVCPRVLNDDGSQQYLNRRDVTVYDLFLRRFLPKLFRALFQKRLDYYEMKDVGYDAVCDVPFVSGSFMFCRTDILKQIGGFDPRYFMYFEDADLTRKFLNYGCRTIYYPHSCVTHLWERAAHKSTRMALIMIQNGIRYFNKWGWKLY